MDIAFIEPTNGLHKYATLGNIHMMLPEAIDHPNLVIREMYRTFYQNQTKYKILDNGANEGGAPTWERLLQMAVEMGANEIVVPDVLLNPTETVQRAIAFGKWLQNQDICDPRIFNYMAAPQGTSSGEYMQCAQQMAEIPYITVLGLPRSMNAEHKMTRAAFLETEGFMQMVINGFPNGVHCLGASTWVKEAVVLSDLPVRSMDTSLVANMSLARRLVTADQHVTRPPDFWTQLYDGAIEEFGDFNHGMFLTWAQQ